MSPDGFEKFLRNDDRNQALAPERMMTSKPAVALIPRSAKMPRSIWKQWRRSSRFENLDLVLIEFGGRQSGRKRLVRSCLI